MVRSFLSFANISRYGCICPLLRGGERPGRRLKRLPGSVLLSDTPGNKFSISVKVLPLAPRNLGRRRTTRAPDTRTYPVWTLRPGRCASLSNGSCTRFSQNSGCRPEQNLRLDPLYTLPTRCSGGPTEEGPASHGRTCEGP